MKRILFCMCIIVVSLQVNAGRYALLIGNNDGGKKLGKLKYIQNDLLSLKQILKDNCGFDDRNISVLYNNSPDQIEKEFLRISKDTASGTEKLFLLYYTGHADQKNLMISGEELPIQKIRLLLAKVDASIKISVFDACQSGSFTRTKGGQLGKPFLFENDNKIKGQVILSSSSQNESAQESDQLKSSVFTFHFINSLRGSADITGDNKVSLLEAYNYSYNQTVVTTTQSWAGIQHPSYNFNIHGEGDIILADLNNQKTGIVFDKDIKGSITIYDKRNNIISEFTKEISKTNRITLNPGSYTIINSDENTTFQNQISLPKNSFSIINKSHLRKSFLSTLGMSKGKFQNTLETAVFTGVNYNLVNLNSINSSVSKSFSSFNELGINPDLSFQTINYFSPVFGLKVNYNKILLQVKRCQFQLNNERFFSANPKHPITSESYNVELNIDQTLTVSIVDLTLGYNIFNPILHLHFGFGLFDINHIIKSKFKDSYFNTITEKEILNTGTLILPQIGLTYNNSFAKFLLMDMGLFYRPQFSNQSIKSNGNIEDLEELKYDFNSLEFQLNLGVKKIW